MPSDSDFTRGDLVTVTFDDGTQVRAWHGLHNGLVRVVTSDCGADQQPGRFRHAFLELNDTFPGASRWVRLLPADDYCFDDQGLGRGTGPHWWIGAFGEFAFDIDMPGVTITAITDDGRAFLRANESPARTRDRLIAQFRALNPTAGDELDTAIDALIEAADERGADREAGRTPY